MDLALAGGGTPAPELYIFTCTWPCQVLRGVVSCALGAGVFSLIFVLRSFCAGPDGNRACCDRQQCSFRCVVANLFHIVAATAVIALSFYEGAFGYPFAVPLEELLTGHGFWMYLLIPGMTTLGTVLSWKTLMWASPPRTRMLSRVYKAPMLLGILTLVGSAWLLYVLRHSVDLDGEDQRSTRSRLILLEAAVIPYAGLAMMLWCWGTVSTHGQVAGPLLQCLGGGPVSIAKWIVCRTLFLWLVSPQVFPTTT